MSLHRGGLPQKVIRDSVKLGGGMVYYIYNQYNLTQQPTGIT